MACQASCDERNVVAGLAPARLTQVGLLKGLSMNVEAGVAGCGVGSLAGAFRSLHLSGPFPENPTCVSPRQVPTHHMKIDRAPARICSSLKKGLRLL